MAKRETLSSEALVPKKIHEGCHHSEEIGWVRSVRRFTAATLLIIIGSAGGGTVALVTLASQAAELRADVRHLDERQAELRTLAERLGVADQRIEREGLSTNREVLVQLGSLRSDVRSIAKRIDRMEESRRSQRRSR